MLWAFSVGCLISGTVDVRDKTNSTANCPGGFARISPRRQHEGDTWSWNLGGLGDPWSHLIMYEGLRRMSQVMAASCFSIYSSGTVYQYNTQVRRNSTHIY